MNQQCRCTHPMHITSASADDVIADLTVVVGGRYVVGENPTGKGVHDDAAGKTVYVARISSFGRAECESNGVFMGFIDPRHLTPAPETSAAPAVDDDLLRAFGAEVLRFAAPALKNVTISYEALGGQLVDSPVGQRLRAAWSAADSTRLLLERDRARDELADARDRHREVTVELTAERNQAVRERGEARAELEAAHQGRHVLQAEVERLRAENAELSRYHGIPSGWKLTRSDAAQQLPDVGPVTPDEDGTSVWIDGERYYLGRMTAANYRLHAARNLALAAHVEARDAEAADTSSDDEVEDPHVLLKQLDVAISDVPGSCVCTEDSDACPAHDLLDRLDTALRARGGQEAGQ